MSKRSEDRVCVYQVHLTGTRTAWFSDNDDAQEYARFYSEMHATMVEVSNPSGLIGQYKKGRPTGEFAELEHIWFPAGPRYDR